MSSNVSEVKVRASEGEEMRRTEQPRRVSKSSPLAVGVLVPGAWLDGFDEQVALQAEDRTREGRDEVGELESLQGEASQSARRA